MIDLCTFLWDMQHESKGMDQRLFVFESNIDDCGKLYYSTDREQSVSIFASSDYSKVTVNYAFLVENSIDDKTQYQTHLLKFIYTKEQWLKLKEEFLEASLFTW